MAETALNFGPDCLTRFSRLRALAHGSTSSAQPPPSNTTLPPKYSLAQHRYGREEMLALIPKDPKKPDCLKKDTSKVVRDTFVMPLALMPHTEDEQRLWARSVNSDAVLRASGKSVPGSGMGRSGRGGSVDRGRGRGRGGYYQRGITHEDSEDGPPTSFSRPKPIERSQSASEKDQRWDDRDRRFDRTYSGRGGGMDDSMLKEQSRSNEYWRKFDKDDDTDWRSSNLRSSDKLGPRGSWRNPIDKERRDLERNPSSRSLNGNSRNSHHQKTSGNNLPEWSVEESNEQDVVGTFDSSGAFLEPKMGDNSMDDIYVSDEADEGNLKNSPEAKKESSKKTPKKSSSPPQLNASIKQSIKQTATSHKPEELMVDKHLPKNIEPQNSKTVPNVAVNKAADHVINPNSVVHHNVNSKSDYTPVTLPNVPEIATSTNSENVVLNHAKNSEAPVPSAATEEDAFAHHKKATENMVAQWSEEEEQQVISQTSASVQEKDIKWYYQDPQGEIQGPFTSPEMLEWFSAGYFTMSLMVRRACDEKFSQLGDLIKSWGRVPFLPGNSPPPIRVAPTSLPNPVTQTIVPNPVAAPVTNQLPKQEDQLLALQQQLLQQQLLQQQLMLRQAQMQQLLAQLKQQDNFTSLNTQQQQQVLMQQFIAQQQRPNMSGVSDQPGLVEAMTPLPLHLLGLPMGPVVKNDLSLWNMTQPSNIWPMNVNVSQPSVTSIWDVDSKSSAEEAELEKQKRLAKEQQEKLRKAEEERLAQEKEMEEKRKLEELRRKEEEERLLKELQKQEEERKKLEEQKRREEEMRRQEELRRIEEQKRKEEELKKQREEELRKIEEQKRLEELKRQEEQKRLEELRRKEEERKQAELLRQEEQRKLEEKRKQEELQKRIEMEKERERIELEKQKEAARLKEIEREQQLQRERQREEEMRRLAEIKLKSQGPAWGIQKTPSDTQLSLADIQRLQEEKEREEREERMRQQILQQQALKQAQQSKNGLSWAKRSVETQPAVKSLAEIQQEEAERLAQQQRNQKPPPPAPVISSNAGVWGNTSHLNRITAAPPSGWNINSVTSSSGFWDDALSSSQPRKQTAKSSDSAFPALSNPEKPAIVVHSNKSKNVRAKKEEDAVTKLFGNRKPTDEFTAWCTDALSALPSSVDVPTFVAFLKDVESPYEVHDYVRSYLGDGKEAREFAKQFLDRRSKFRAKQIPAEENTLWGPAPAVNPVVNKSSNSQPSNDNDGNSNAKGKSKRRKNRMQKLDSSMLGFTVQSNPDRLNVGEIDHVDGM